MNLKKLNIPCILVLLLSMTVFSPTAIASRPTDDMKASIDNVLATLRQASLDKTNKHEQIKSTID